MQKQEFIQVSDTMPDLTEACKDINMTLFCQINFSVFFSSQKYLLMICNGFIDCFFLLRQSQYIDQAVLKLAILLTQLLKCWDKHVSLHSTLTVTSE